MVSLQRTDGAFSGTNSSTIDESPAAVLALRARPASGSDGPGYTQHPLTAVNGAPAAAAPAIDPATPSAGPAADLTLPPKVLPILVVIPHQDLIVQTVYGGGNGPHVGGEVEERG